MQEACFYLYIFFFFFLPCFTWHIIYFQIIAIFTILYQYIYCHTFYLTSLASINETYSDSFKNELK